MHRFVLNGYVWSVVNVPPNDSRLIDRLGSLTVATTDPSTMTVYLSDAIGGYFLTKVLVHEIAHCVLFSYGLLNEIHMLARPDKWIEAEEWVCNFIADYGLYVYDVAYSILGHDAIYMVPYEMECCLL